MRITPPLRDRARNAIRRSPRPDTLKRQLRRRRTQVRHDVRLLVPRGCAPAAWFTPPCAPVERERVPRRRAWSRAGFQTSPRFGRASVSGATTAVGSSVMRRLVRVRSPRAGRLDLDVVGGVDRCRRGPSRNRNLATGPRRRVRDDGELRRVRAVAADAGSRWCRGRRCRTRSRCCRDSPRVAGSRQRHGVKRSLTRKGSSHRGWKVRCVTIDIPRTSAHAGGRPAPMASGAGRNRSPRLSEPRHAALSRNDEGASRGCCPASRS